MHHIILGMLRIFFITVGLCLVLSSCLHSLSCSTEAVRLGMNNFFSLSVCLTCDPPASFPFRWFSNMNWHKLRMGQLDAPTVSLIRKASQTTGRVCLLSCEKVAFVWFEENRKQRTRPVPFQRGFLKLTDF